jgi:hypothetical protein
MVDTVKLRGLPDMPAYFGAMMKNRRTRYNQSIQVQRSYEGLVPVSTRGYCRGMSGMTGYIETRGEKEETRGRRK